MMKSTGIVRKVDELGRLVIPKELRKTLGIGEKDPIEIFIDGHQIILQKYAPNEEKEEVIKKLNTLRNQIKNPNAQDVINRAINLIK
ncbi:AbrB/MazE/SpoVT family DNA-binding domain-containing protein [Ureibacillus sp. FSL E2-3493]|uniref:AbrB/MazE/SpoVT family DNA-binding domain-containing protein n=1 Tax=Ureibacillus sp. FSL E2-3493 TaxID=2921367 RepID=UPI003119B950